MSKTARTVLGLALTTAGVAGWFMLPDRSEWVALAMVGIGSWNISMERTTAGLKAAAEFVKGIRS